MKRFNIIKNIALMGLMALGATSCEDWLTLYPQDRVVEENFWEDKNDLEGVRYAAYNQMAGTINKLIIWGDLRSDSYKLNDSHTTSSDGKGKAAKELHDTYKKVIEAQLDSTMSIYDWGSVYTTINYCNKVLQHGPDVLKRDAQFTSLEWQEMRAELTGLRALNYFYLVRAFKDIPYSNRVINSDTEVMDFPLTNGLVVLDSLISDVRTVTGQARNRFGSNSDTYGLMTNSGIYALLAEMYLWRSALREGRSTANVVSTTDGEGEETASVGFTDDQIKSDCDSVIYFGQLSLDALAYRNTMASTSTFDRASSRTKDYGAGIPNSTLIANENMSSEYMNGSSPQVDSYSAIFNTGNSLESIFELQYTASDQRKNTNCVHFWGYTSQNDTHLKVSNDALKQLVYNNNSEKMNQDSRIWYGCTNAMAGAKEDLPGYFMFKWSNCNFLNESKLISVSTSQSEYNNWIFYRQTDVMLMMAEAYAARNNSKDDLEKCKNIVNAIHKRSTVNESLSLYDTKTRDAAIKMVMSERQIELLGEGKRWFDLTRYAERIGGGYNPDPREPQYLDGAKGVQQMVTDYLAQTYPDDEAMLKNRIKNRYGLGVV